MFYVTVYVFTLFLIKIFDYLGISWYLILHFSCNPMCYYILFFKYKKILNDHVVEIF